MLPRLRRCEARREASGVTPTEPLVAILDIGALAAIAIPSFPRQQAKTANAQIEALARTPQTTLETVAGDYEGSHQAVTAEAPNRIEPSTTREPTGTITRECHSPLTLTGCNGGASSTW
jgi:type II secretory pathway pseudopilin PulG